MFVGGLRALLLQSLHPLAMAGVAGHSGYRGDPWGRLHRTSYFLAVTTFGTADDAQADGRPDPGDPPAGAGHRARRPALRRLRPAPAALGAPGRGGQLPRRPPALRRRAAGPGRPGRLRRRHRPGGRGPRGASTRRRTEAAVRAELAAYRPELQGTAEARDAARFMLLQPPLPLVAARAVRGAGRRRGRPAAALGPLAAAAALPAAGRGRPWCGWPATAWCAASGGR